MKPKPRTGTRAEKDAKRMLIEEAQAKLDKVELMGAQLENVFEFKYLGFTFQAGGDRRRAVAINMAKARARFSKLWNIWDSKVLPLTAKIRLFEAAVVSVLIYGCEVWILDEALCASLRGWCAKCMHHITNKSITEECRDPTYPLVDVVRQRRLRWLGKVLCMHEGSLVRKVVLKVAQKCLDGKRTTSKAVLIDAPQYRSVNALVKMS